MDLEDKEDIFLTCARLQNSCICLSKESSQHDWEPAWLKAEHITEAKVYIRW